MKPGDAINHALGMVGSYDEDFPMPEAEMMARMNAVQRKMFAAANEVNREYFGDALEVDLEEGCVNLVALRDQNALPEVERIDRIEVATTSGGTYNRGDEVYMVEAWDAKAHPEPRVLLRSHLIEQVEDDLSTVRSIRIYYSRYPFLISPRGFIRGGATQVDLEIGEPWDWILVWDLARAILRRDPDVAEDVRELRMKSFMISEKEMAAQFLAHVRNFAYGMQSRFGDA